MFAPQVNPFESIMFGKGEEIKPGIRDHLHRFGDPVDIFSGPYIPSDDDKVVPLTPSGGDFRFANPFGMASHDKPFSKYPPAAGGSDGRWPGMSTDDIKRYVYPSDNLLNIPITPFGMKALIPRDDALGDIIRQQDRDIFDEYRRIDGENPDPFGPLPIRKAGKFITDLMA